MLPALRRLAGKTVRVDPAGSPVWFAQQLRQAGRGRVARRDPCLLPKACKNEGEQQGARAAHLRDAVAVCRFLHWLSVDAPTGGETEMSAADALLAFRREVEGFRGESFPAISGAGEHGAIIHYRVTEETNRPIKPNEVYLIDSGAQYPDGTTDITRTVWTGPDAPPDSLRDRVTRVMQGHIAIATAVFPARRRRRASRCAGARARYGRWGWITITAPGTASAAICRCTRGRSASPGWRGRCRSPPGMILSNEPGLLPAGPLWHPPGKPVAGAASRCCRMPSKPFLRFETLTLAPFDRRLLSSAQITQPERAWLDAYHRRVLQSVGPLLEQTERDWLEWACAPLAPVGSL